MASGVPSAQSLSVGADPASSGLSAIERYFEISLYLFVATGLLSVVFTGELDLFSTIAVPAAVLYKGTRLWRKRGPELSSRVATELVLGYFIFFPFDLWMFSRAAAGPGPNAGLYAGVLSAVHLMLFAALVRLYSARTSRDYAFLAVLAIAAILASAVLTADTRFLIALAVFLVLAVSTFVALDLRRGAVGAVSARLESGSRFSARLARVLVATSVLVAVATLGLGSTIFFVIPRFRTGYFSALDYRQGMATGFTDTVTLGQIGEIQRSRAVAMRVRIHGNSPHKAVSPPADGWHWRGVALTNFDGRRWFTPPEAYGALSPVADGLFAVPGETGAAPPGPYVKRYARRIRYTILKEPMASDALFVLARPVALAGRFGPLPGTTSPVGDQTGSLFSRGVPAVRVRYDAISDVSDVPPAVLRRAAGPDPGVIRAEYLQLPVLDPRVARLAADAAARTRNRYDTVSAMLLYLKSHYRYTLRLRGSPTGDPLADFLFRTRAGNCEYFASALTVMLRSRGIPSRYAGGFLGGEYNPLAGDYIVRESDAHAWTEVYFPNYGWITFDPTPAGTAQPEGLLDRAAFVWDWFQLSWNEWVINYDFTHQMILARGAESTSRAWNDQLRNFSRRQQARITAWLLALDARVEKSRVLLTGLLVILVGAFLVLRGRAVARYLVARAALRLRGGLSPSLAALEYAEMLRLLEKRGWKKSASQTPREFAAAIPRAELWEPVARFTSLYESARFGRHPASPPEMASLLRSIRDRSRVRRAKSQ